MAGQSPTVSSISPVTGTTNGGTAVTITGLHFTDSTVNSVQIGGVVATELVVVNDTTITCVTAIHAPGLVDVVVNADNGSGILSDGYTYSGGSVMATVYGVNETLMQAGSHVDARIGGHCNVKYAQDSYTCAALASGSVIKFGIHLKKGEVPLSYWFYTAALSTTGTVDFGLFDTTDTALDVDCFADAYDSSAAALHFSGNDAAATITAAILAGTITTAAAGIGVPMTADGYVGATINTANATGLIWFGLTYAALP